MSDLNIKKSTQKRSVLLVLFAFLFGLSISGKFALAQDRHGAHEHGVGTLNLAIEGKDVEIELIAPGADIVGFEHKATTEVQKKAVREAVDTLKNALSLFSLSPAAGCTLAEAEVKSSLIEEGDDQGHKHGHKDDHKDDHKAGHKDEPGEEHAEFSAHYHFKCTDISQLTLIDISFFKMFPSAHELEARIITPTGQSSKELTPQSSQLSF